MNAAYHARMADGTTATQRKHFIDVQYFIKRKAHYPKNGSWNAEMPLVPGTVEA